MATARGRPVPAADPKDLLQSKFGHSRFLPLQEQVIEQVLDGKDCFVLMPTGSGKSLCYQLPALCLDGLTLVISPLIALMKDQVDALQARGIAADCVNSAMGPAHNRRAQKAAYMGQLDILYVAPERVSTPKFRDFLHALKLSLIAIDEAHCISEWGHDFRPDYRNLQVLRDNFPTVPVIALTASATERVREDILNQLRMPNAAQFVASFNRPNLTYRVRPKRRSLERLVELLSGIRDGSAIIYRFSRQNTEALASDLRDHGFQALPYHAGLDDEVRRETQERFLRNEVPIIVATIAFGMGVDKPNVRLVVHYDLPKTIEGYYQETGRAGRDGLPSACVLFYSYGDKINQEYFINQIEDDAERGHAKEKLAKMVAYGEANTCRRAYLLNYFGEAWTQKNCGACDVCLAKIEQPDDERAYDGTQIAQKVLSAVIRTGERFGVNHVVDVLRGSRSQRVRQFHHDELPVHGIARGYAKDELQDVIDQLIEKGLLARNTSSGFPTISVTAMGKEFLKNRDALTLVGMAPIRESEGEPDTLLFEKLRSLRRELSAELSVPAYVVFSDETLRQMALLSPEHHEALLLIKGVGPIKAQQFGRQFLEAIRAHASKDGSNGTSQRPEQDAEASDEPAIERAKQSHSRAYEVWTSEEEEELARLFATGRSLNEIAAALGRQPSAISSRLRLTGASSDHRQSLSATEERTLELVRQGLTLAEVAAARSISPGTVVAHVERIARVEESLDIIHLLPTADRYAAIVEAFRAENDDSRLKPVRERLGEDYAYEELRLVRLRLRQLSTGIAMSSSKFDVLTREQD